MRLLKIGLLSILLLADLGIIFYYASTYSTQIPTIHIDGAFQTASALHRLADGQAVGRDFQAYLGLGTIYFNYPLFWFKGGDLAASLFASHFSTFFIFFFSSCLIAGMIFYRRPFYYGVVLGSAALVLLAFLFPNVPYAIEMVVTPGNSLRSLRSFLPFICVAIAHGLLKSRLSPQRQCIALSLLAGMSLPCSNDYGGITGILLVLFTYLLAYRHRVLSVRLFFLVPALAALFGFVVLMVLTRGHIIEWLNFNLSDVGRNQFWYFCPWSPENRVWGLADLLPKFIAECNAICGGLIYGAAANKPSTLWCLTPLFLLVYGYFHRTLECALLVLLWVALACGSLVPVIGGHLNFYSSSFVFWSMAILVLLSCFWLVEAGSFGLRRSNRTVIPPWFDAGVLIAVLAAAISQLLADHATYKADVRAIETNPGFFYVEELGGYLPAEYRNYIDRARVSAIAGEDVLEEYWGLWSAVTDRRQNLPVDSVIHALGTTQDSFRTAIERLPDRVVTTVSLESYGWQPWSLSANWWFYKSIIENYLPERASPTTLLWHKPVDRSALPNWQPVDCRIVATASGPAIGLQEGPAGFYEIILEYKNSDPDKRRLVQVRNNLVYVCGEEGYLTLDPWKTEIAFPALVGEGEQRSLDFRVLSAHPGDFSSVAFNACRAKRYVFNDLEARRLVLGF